MNAFPAMSRGKGSPSNHINNGIKPLPAPSQLRKQGNGCASLAPATPENRA